LYNLIKDGFWKDLIIVILVSILIGSLFIVGFSYMSNYFLAQTVSGLAGESGEYDIIIHTKLNMADDAERMLLSIAEAFEGMKIKRTVNLFAKANFFVSLGKNKTNSGVVGFLSNATQLPGYSGSTIIMEPRLTVSGIADKTYQIMKTEILQIDGVDFLFKFGNDVQIICETTDNIAKIQRKVSEVLNKYYIVEIKSRDDIFFDKNEFKKEIRNLLYEKDVFVYNLPAESSLSNSKELGEVFFNIKDLFELWRTKVEISEESLTKDALMIGQKFVLSTTDVYGKQLDDNDIVVAITDKVGGKYIADVISGDTGYLEEPFKLDVYILNDNKIGKRTGNAVVNNPRVQIGKIADKTSLMAYNVESAFQNIMDSVQVSVDVAHYYNMALDSLISLQNALKSIGITSDGIELSLNSKNIGYINQVISNVSSTLDNLEKLASKVSFFTSAFDVLLGNISTMRNALNIFSQKVDTIVESVYNGGELAEFLLNILDITEIIMVNMNELDLKTISESINNITETISDTPINEISFVAEEIEKIKKFLPAFTDEDINNAINLLDTYVKNEPFEENIQFLIKSENNLDQQLLDNKFQTEFGDTVDYICLMEVGMVQSGVRGEIDKLLANVKSLVAYIMTAIFMVYIMLFDHAQLMAFSVSLMTNDIKYKWQQMISYSFTMSFFIVFGIFLIVQTCIGEVKAIYFLMIGVLAAIIAVLCCRNFAKIDICEMEACYAFGIRQTDIVREVVIPSGKPGILSAINRRRLRFPLNGYVKVKEFKDISGLDHDWRDFFC